MVVLGSLRLVVVGFRVEDRVGFMADDEMTTEDNAGSEGSPADAPVSAVDSGSVQPEAGVSEAVSGSQEVSSNVSSDVASAASGEVVGGEESIASDEAAVGEGAVASEEVAELPQEDEEVNEFGFRADEMIDDEDEEEEDDEDASPIEELVEEVEVAVDVNDLDMRWYILKVQVNREKSICENLKRRVRLAGLDAYFGDILVPTEDVREYSKSGKQRVVKRKLYPGYIVVHMAITDESWFMVRETSGIGDFTGAAGKPAPLSPEEIDRIISTTKPSEDEEGEEKVKIGIKFKVGDQVRVKEGYFQNYEGEVSSIDERNGRITVMINIFGRNNPVELDHWQVEDV